MAILGKNGFVRKQEIAFAKKLLVWKYEKSNVPKPSEEAISAYAEQVVNDAHRIVKESGGTLSEILKNRVKNFRR